MNRSGLATRVIAGMVVAIGSLTLCGWIFGIQSLKTVFPGLISMKANTALCFILAGLSLGLQSRPSPNPAALHRRLGQVFALGVFCIGFLVLCEWIFGWDLGIDQLFFRDVPEPVPLSAPGRPAPVTVLNFCLLGLALFFLDSATRRNRWPAQYLTLTVVATTLVAFIGYFYGIGNFHLVAPYASVALHTVVGFLLLCAGILLARPQHGAMALVMGATPGGIMVRRMLLPGIFVTILFGGLAVWSERAGFYGFGFNTALLVTALIAILASLIWWAARSVDRLELERQRGAEEVREGNVRLQLAHQAAHIGAFEWNVQTGVNVWTPELEAMYGLKPGEFGRTQPAWEQLVHPEDRGKAVGFVERAFETFQPEEGEWRVVWPDSTVHWLAGRVQVFKDHAGKPLRLTGVNLDITDRKKSEEALRRSEERFRTMANAIPQLAWIARADGHIFWYNRRWYEYTGATPEQMEGWGWQSVHDPQVLPKVLEQWRRSIATGQSFDMEFPLRGADGRFRTFLTRIMPLKDKEGRVELWFGTNTDISEQKQEQAKLAAIVENSDDAIVSMGIDGIVTSWNPAAERLYGYRAKEIIGQPTALIIPEDCQGEEMRSLERLRRGEHIDPYETVRVTKDGRRIDVLVTLSPLRNLAGTIIGGAKIIRDVTARKKAEERQAFLLAEVQAANANLQDFATVVSHDLKTPLRGVATLAKWLQSDYADKLDEEGRDHLAEMIKRTSRMDRMIDDILQYSRAGRAEEKLEPVPLAELVPAVVQDLAPPAQVRVRIAPGLPVVQGEPVRLRQLFQNLLGNAIKHANKPQVEIQVGWADVGSLWQFSVTDNGPGIEERYFGQIFKIFQTLAPKDRTDSTGVGLALVKRIVERAGGRIWVESRLGEGSTFHFTWPKRLRPGTAEPADGGLTETVYTVTGSHRQIGLDAH